MLCEWNLLVQSELLTDKLFLCVSVPCAFLIGLLNVFIFFSDHIYEALLYTDIDVDSLEPDSILYEDSIKLIVKKSGMKYKSAKLREEKERENKDAVKRWTMNHFSLFFSAYLLLQVLFVYFIFF